MKNRLFQFDFGVQVLCLLFFLFVALKGDNPIWYYLILCQLLLGFWQLLSAAFWGLAFVDYFRSQFLIVAIFSLAGVWLVLNLPEFRDAEIIMLVARFATILMMGIYLQKTYLDAKQSWTNNQMA